jgi:hypothetical protein
LGDSGAGVVVGSDFIEGGNLFRAVGTAEVAFEEVCLNALFAVGRSATRGFDGILEELMVNGADKGGI